MVLSLISRRDDAGGKAFQNEMDVPSPQLGLEKGLILCAWPEEELIPLDLGKTSLAWICLLRNNENLQALEVSLLWKKRSSDPVCKQQKLLWGFERDFSLLRHVLLGNILSNLAGFSTARLGVAPSSRLGAGVGK